MNLPSKKTLAVFLMGAFLIVGTTAPLLVNAVQAKGIRTSASRHPVDPDKMATQLSNTFLVDKDTVLKHYNSGSSYRDLNTAAFLAKASGQSFEEVLALKTSENSWKDVFKTLGVTKEQLRGTRQDIAASQLTQRLGLDKDRAHQLLGEGYKAPDIAMASLLAENSGKPVYDVLQLKKINNTWHQVAETLGVDNATFKQDAQRLHQAFPRSHSRNRPA